jgi:hypothetical protein
LLVQAFLLALVYRCPGLREVVSQRVGLLGTDNHSALSHALRRVSGLRFVRGLIDRLTAQSSPRPDELVAIDSMAVTLPATTRHHCRKFNNQTVGGGVLWTFRLRAPRGRCPVQILHTMRGAWHDSKLMRSVSLIPGGPVYLMDRGFYAFDLLERWLSQGVRFVVRVREKDLQYKVLKQVTAPHRAGPITIHRDVWACIGGPSAKVRPQVRLIQATIHYQGRPLTLTLATSILSWTAGAVLDAYKKRWKIERFHHLVKEVIGLAHLYSFDATGVEFLLHVALLLALLLFLDADDTPEHADTVAIIRGQLTALRDAAGLMNPWKRNAMITRRKYKPPKPANP